jgi:mRNA interferase RelE/StbE
VSGGFSMAEKEKFHYEIQYTKAADKFLKDHEDVRKQYEEAIKELLIGDHPEKVNVSFTLKRYKS